MVLASPDTIRSIADVILFEMRLGRSVVAGEGASSSTARARFAGADGSFMFATVGDAAWWGNAPKRHVFQTASP